MGKYYKINNENNYNVSTKSPVKFLLCGSGNMIACTLAFYCRVSC